jgi:hypothetical protein
MRQNRHFRQYQRDRRRPDTRSVVEGLGGQIWRIADLRREAARADNEVRLPGRAGTGNIGWRAWSRFIGVLLRDGYRACASTCEGTVRN